MEVCYCLEVHQGRQAPRELMHVLDGNIIMAKTGVFSNVPIRGADNQVHVAYSLVSLLYATFDVCIPDEQTSPLWGAFQVYDLRSSRRSKPAFECLALDSDLPGLSKDKYDLKPNLRAGRLRLEESGNRPTRADYRFIWDRDEVMAWRKLLSELVGYAKYVQSLVPEQPGVCVLTEMHEWCARERDRLQEELDQRKHGRIEATVQFAHHAGHLRRLLSRMLSLINT